MILRSIVVALVCWATVQVKTATIDDIYPSLGPDGASKSLSEDIDDTSSPEIQLQVPINFYGQKFRSLFVNSNGFISFKTEIPNFSNVKLPLRFPVIAPLYTDVDTRGSGRVYYRETSEQNLITKAQNDIRKNFENFKDFVPTSLFITTWENVGYFDRGIDKVNTFQVVIASNESESFAFFNYLDNGIQWIQSQGKNPNYPDARAQAGFNSETGDYYALPGSGTDQVVNMELLSNVGMPGVWLFNIGTRKIIPANENNDNSLFASELGSQTCASNGASRCHSSSQCIDYVEGFCCKCNSGFYGNGRNCLKNGEPLRVNGKINGLINGVRIKDVDLHSYVVADKGRTYTAMSRMPSSIGYDMQSLITIGTTIGWMFASADPGAKNGYQLTGGVMNRTVEIEFPQTGNHVAIKQYFKGLDAFGYLELMTDITGSIPAISEGTRIHVRDFDNQYTKVGPGMYKSHSRHAYEMRNSRVSTPFVVDETIQYEECAFGPKDEQLKSMRMRTARSYLIYDSNEEIVRYAMTNRITLISSADPCRDAKCGPHSKCVADRSNYKCVCDLGYELVYPENSNLLEGRCSDVNECLTARANCHVNAECINEIGTFTCHCRPGYTGNGVECEKTITCSDLNCNIDATCRLQDNGEPICICNPGYAGDGYVCKKEDAFVDCRRMDYCHENAECAYVQERQRAECRCKLGYKGDGRQCERERSCDDMNCDVNAVCLYSQEGLPQCLCNEGYKGDGYVCQQESTHVDCRRRDYCAETADCVYNQEKQWAECRCKSGYKGDGATCEKMTCEDLNCGNNASCRLRTDELPECACNTGFIGDGYRCQKDDRHIDCRQVNNCHVNAACVYNEEKQWAECRCRQGYRGDGFTCERHISCSDLQCDPNASCVSSQEQLPQCVCNAGFTGDGYVCQEESTHVDCRQVDNCDINADCIFNDETQRGECQCSPGYRGDGITCERDLSCQDLACNPNATCKLRLDGLPECFCNDGFVGDGYACQEEPRKTTCDELACHANATCLYLNGKEPQCKCNKGYVGDGYFCQLQTEKLCDPNNPCSENADCYYDAAGLGYVCKCKEGYAGDGFSCLPLDECNSIDDCDFNAQCLYDEVSTRYICQCNQGYDGDGKTCLIDPNAGCDVLKDCHPDAICVYDSVNDLHRCQCNPGFQGDGLDCSTQQMSCNVVNNCDLNAECVYEYSEQGYRCLCRQGFRGNGYTCISMRTCADEPRLCHSNADCVLRDDINQYICQCRQGYTGDGSICRVIPQNEGEFLIFNQGMSVLKMPLIVNEKDKGKIIIMEPFQTAVGLDVDCLNGYVYWTDLAEPKIRRARYNGSDIEVVLDQDLKSPEGIAVDWVSNNIYWTDSMKDTVEVMSLNGKYRKVLVNTDLKNPRGIAVHPSREKLYWADWHRDSPKIEFSNLDGSGRKVLVSDGLGLPNALSIDFTREELCWADAGTQRIECLGMLDGRRRTIASPISYPFGLTTYKDVFYWTDWQEKFIHKLKRGETEAEKIPVPLGGNGKLYSIAAVPLKCPRGSNSCAIQNGGCKFICLPNGQGSRSCACPDDMGNATSTELAACNEIY